LGSKSGWCQIGVNQLAKGVALDIPGRWGETGTSGLIILLISSQREARRELFL
jgi:hypothetical protein